ncbi:MAG: hypothetical protein K9G46_02020 [Flavobacteriales bacterium]|nr:hypothetical protein [Flavobacteriales bacterium]
MNTTWHFLVNQFENSTSKNYAKAFKLSNYHDAYLHKMFVDHPGEPDWDLLYNRYHPFHQLYVSIYTAWKNAGGQQAGQTLNLDQLLVLLLTRVNKWDALVQAVDGFEKGTVNYKSIFPQGRAPFGTGAKTLRVEAVNVLKQNLAAYPALASVETLVDDFYTLLDNARDTQEGAKGGTKQLSQEVDEKRILAMTEQYRNLGYLINKGADTPQMIAPFFDLNVLRESRQTEFTGTLDPLENEAILIHTFVADDEMRIGIKGSATIPNGTMVNFYLASTPNGTDSTVVQVEADVLSTIIAAADFGITNYSTHRYLTVVNPNAEEMRYVVELI